MNVSVQMVCAVALLLAGTVVRPSSLEKELSSLVESENAFAATSVAKGMREAFLAYLADDAILFRPHPVNGKEWTGNNPDPPITLSWHPVFADISADGSVGYTTGPWELNDKSPEQCPSIYGYFVSVWKKQSGGEWRVVMDLGTRNPPPTNDPPGFSSPVKKSEVTKGGQSTERDRQALLESDHDFKKLVDERGTSAAFLAISSVEVRLYRTGKFPVVGRDSARTVLENSPGFQSWEPTSANIAGSGDLGYTYGKYTTAPGPARQPVEEGHFMRIWKRERSEPWKIVLEVLNPLREG